MDVPFLDTNILLRHLAGDHPQLSPKATALLGRVERGDLTVRISDLVIFETVFSLQRAYRVPREQIVAALAPVIELPGILLPGKRQYQRVFELYTTTPLGFADCFHVVLMQRLGITDVLSFDTDFDRVPGILRKES
jgi:predicted nucleic acid-binding protein